MPPEEFVKWLETLPPDVIANLNEKEMEQAEAEYIEFAASFRDGKCYLCGKPLKTFSVKNPCLHWLLRPKGFKKKHFPLLFDAFSFSGFLHMSDGLLPLQD